MPNSSSSEDKATPEICVACDPCQGISDVAAAVAGAAAAGEEAGTGLSGGSGSTAAEAASSSASAASSGSTSSKPINYANGQIVLSSVDLSWQGFGFSWSHVRSYANLIEGDTVSTEQGMHWFASSQPYLTFVTQPGFGPTIGLVTSATTCVWFEQDGEGGWRPRFSSKEQLRYDTVSTEFIVTLTSGFRLKFYSDNNSALRGRLKKMETPFGIPASVNYNADNEAASIEWTDETSGRSAAFRYTYDNAGYLKSVTLEIDRQSVRRSVYAYVDNADAFPLAGTAGDLLSAVVEQWEGTAWATVWEEAYRYYVEDEEDGFVHGLKMIFQSQSVAALREAGLNPWESEEGPVASHADLLFKYDAEKRVVEERVNGGTEVYQFAWLSALPQPDYGAVNSWSRRCVETTPDGNQTVVYTNREGVELLRMRKSGSEKWSKFNKFDVNCNAILIAEPSAVAGVTEPGDAAGELNVELKSFLGLIYTYEYYGFGDSSDGAAPGYLKASFVQQGALAVAPVLLEERAYSKAWGEPVAVYALWKSFIYPVAGASQSDAALTDIERWYFFDDTSFAYTYQVQRMTVTPPVISTAQNGTGAEEPLELYLDRQGRIVWVKNARGFIDHYSYDEATNARIQMIRDVNTALVSGSPWSTPADGGKNLITDYVNDAQGRVLKTLHPWIEVDPATWGCVGTEPLQVRPVDYSFYRDDIHQVWRAKGYMTGPQTPSWHTLGPVSLILMDAGGRITDEIQCPASCGCGPLGPDTFGKIGKLPSQSLWTRWTHYLLDQWGRALEMRVYFAIPFAGDGFESVNYDSTRFAYDLMGRQYKTVSPGGTITYTLYNSRSLRTEVWVGTNDAGASPNNPSGGGATGNNMKPVWLGQYDNGFPGRDGNLTLLSLPVDASSGNDRINTYSYDYRDRRISTTTNDGTSNFITTAAYDNLDKIIDEARYHGSVSVANRTHDRTTAYDNRDRVYQRKRFYVNTDGTLGDALVAGTWYDPNGNALKQTVQGAKVVTKLVYDSVDRPVKKYRVSENDSTSGQNTNNVVLDIVIQQDEVAYDDAGQAISTSNRARFDDATGTGSLQGPDGAQPKSRDSFVAVYPDPIGRSCFSANYGTNGGASWIRPAVHSVPSELVLVSAVRYARDGGTDAQIDPEGIAQYEDRDAAGRRIRIVENACDCCDCVAQEARGLGHEACGDNDRTAKRRVSRFQYAPDGGMSRLLLTNASSGEQVTTWSYGSTLDTSAIARSDLPVKKSYPNGAFETQSYNRQNEVTGFADANGTTHAYRFDKLGRRTDDGVPILGAASDGVRRISTSYDERGRPQYITSADNATPGAGTVVNQVRRDYNGLDCLTSEWQSHSGVVDGATPRVQYVCSAGASNILRRTSVVYPNGRAISYEYGATGSIDDVLNRAASVHDSDLTALAEFQYVGASVPAVSILPQPSLQRSWKKQPGEPNGDAGDPYTGYDRFGRVEWMRWFKQTGDAYAAVMNVQWGYNQNSLKLWRKDLLAPASTKQDQHFGYDGLSQIVQRQRGLLNVNTSAVGGIAAQEEGFTYDETGNWLNYKVSEAGVVIQDQDRANDKCNQLTQINDSSSGIYYYRNGNMVLIPTGPSLSDPPFSLGYDAWNRLTNMMNSSETWTGIFQYDGLMRRITTGSLGSGIDSHLYYNDQWRSIEGRSVEAEDPQTQYIWHPERREELLLRDDLSGMRIYSLKDHLDPVAICDDAGVVLERYAYSAFGLPSILKPDFALRPGNYSEYAWNFLFHSEFADYNTGWYNYGFRYYVAALGRWLSRDPIGERGGPNLYAYVSNRPIDLVDRLGLAGTKTGTANAAKYNNGPLFDTWGEYFEGVGDALAGEAKGAACLLTFGMYQPSYANANQQIGGGVGTTLAAVGVMAAPFALAGSIGVVNDAIWFGRGAEAAAGEAGFNTMALSAEASVAGGEALMYAESSYFASTVAGDAALFVGESGAAGIGTGEVYTIAEEAIIMARMATQQITSLTVNIL